MTERLKFNGTAMPVEEAIRDACGLVFPRAQPKMFRMNYWSMCHLMMAMGSRCADLIEEESRAYLVLWTPTGRLLVYADPKCERNTGVLTCTGADVEIDVDVELSC